MAIQFHSVHKVNSLQSQGRRRNNHRAYHIMKIKYIDKRRVRGGSEPREDVIVEVATANQFHPIRKILFSFALAI